MIGGGSGRTGGTETATVGAGATRGTSATRGERAHPACGQLPAHAAHSSLVLRRRSIAARARSLASRCSSGATAASTGAAGVGAVGHDSRRRAWLHRRRRGLGNRLFARRGRMPPRISGNSCGLRRDVGGFLFRFLEFPRLFDRRFDHDRSRMAFSEMPLALTPGCGMLATSVDVSVAFRRLSGPPSIPRQQPARAVPGLVTM